MNVLPQVFLFCIQLAVSPSYEIERSASQKDYRLVIGLKLLTSWLRSHARWWRNVRVPVYGSASEAGTGTYFDTIGAQILILLKNRWSSCLHVYLLFESCCVHDLRIRIVVLLYFYCKHVHLSRETNKTCLLDIRLKLQESTKWLVALRTSILIIAVHTTLGCPKTT